MFILINLKVSFDLLYHLHHVNGFSRKIRNVIFKDTFYIYQTLILINFQASVVEPMLKKYCVNKTSQKRQINNCR